MKITLTSVMVDDQAKAYAFYTEKLGFETRHDIDLDRVVAEAADVLYHLLVMLHARGVTLAEIETLLETRTKKSGLEEKASRPRE